MTQPTAYRKPLRHTLRKSERVTSRATIETLFGGGRSRAMSAFPLRMVYMLAPRKEGEPAAQILVSVSKRWFKRAVKRNRVKRQVREAYRMAKQPLTDAVETLCPGQKLVMAFIFIDGTLHPSSQVAEKVERLLARLREKLPVAAARTAVGVNRAGLHEERHDERRGEQHDERREAPQDERHEPNGQAHE